MPLTCRVCVATYLSTYSGCVAAVFVVVIVVGFQIQVIYSDYSELVLRFYPR